LNSTSDVGSICKKTLLFLIDLNNKSESHGLGKVQGVVKVAQTGILWSQVQVLVGPPIVKKPLILKSVALFMEAYSQH
jgi:hypothetical protein